jgi:hypothetical protein
MTWLTQTVAAEALASLLARIKVRGWHGRPLQARPGWSPGHTDGNGKVDRRRLRGSAMDIEIATARDARLNALPCALRQGPGCGDLRRLGAHGRAALNRAPKRATA